jgi:putative hydrolase of the HAD superfamily
MGMHKSNGSVIVFDLDDTLFKESEYCASGMAEICRWIESHYGISVQLSLKKLQEAGERDLLESLCLQSGLPITLKESLLWIYRLHSPIIRLDDEVENLLTSLWTQCTVAILTDGRALSQRLKLRALGLTHLPVYISEDYGESKPSLGRFEILMKELPGTRYFYVGDNPQKDFIAPNELGWTTIGLRDDGRNIHKQEVAGIPSRQLPSIWIDSLKEILPLIC